MTYHRSGSWRSRLYSSVLAAAFALPGAAMADGPLTTLLEDFESGPAGAAAVTAANSPAAANSGSVIAQEVESSSGRLKITDPDGGTNGAVITLPGAITAPGYYLFTADVKIDNASAPIHSYGMGVNAGAYNTSKISDVNAGYVMNLTGSGDAALGYQTIGAAVNVPAGGSFPQDAVLYFGTDVSGNDYNALAVDGDFNGRHRTNTATWAGGSANAVYVDNIKRHGPGNMGEERHLWISVGDGYTNLSALENMLVQAKANNFTAVDILARYRADAYYVPNRTDASYPNPEPFGTRVGVVNASPENDPLQYAIDRCRELDLKVYISFSAFLVTTSTGPYPSTLPDGSVMGILPSGATEPRDMVTGDNANEGLWADFGREDVREYTKNILLDIVANYDIDGVIFDRVRYPGTRFGFNEQALDDMGFTSAPSPFSAAFRDARRGATADFIQECYEAVTDLKPWIVVGATPIAFGSGMADTYNNVFQHWPTWTSRTNKNREVSFGIIDLLQPQFYRLTSTAAPHTAPEANNTLMKKAVFGDLAVDSLDYGLMPGAYNMLAPLFYHPAAGNAAQSQANAQNFTDARLLDLSGFGLFAATSSLADMHLIRDPGASTAGTDVLAGTPTKVDYLFKKGYDNIKPNAVTEFNADPQARGSVIFTWDDPAPASDGETASKYVIYKSTTQPVREVWANQVTKLPVSGNWFHAPVAEAGNFYYRIVPIDDYNNRGEATEIGPFTVTGTVSTPDDIIIDNLQATRVGTWSTGAFGAYWGSNYYSRGGGTGSQRVDFTFTAPVTGTYTVSEWHVQGGNRTTAAPHVIQHAGGTANVSINQQINGGKWNSLGDYTFTAGNTYTVSITDNFPFVSGIVVMADAIKISFVPTPTVTPAQPTNLTATAVSTSQINISWDDNANNESGYELERTICGGTTVLIPLPAGTTSYSDNMLAADTEYKYVVRAWNTGAQSPDSNVAAARTFIAAPDDIIIDDRQAQLFGPWTLSVASTGYNGTYALTFKGAGDRTATFSFTPERTAVYDVAEWHIAGTNRAADAPHTVYHAGGASVVPVNQQLNGSQWNTIGSYLFEEGLTYSVVIQSNFTVGSALMADGIRISYNAEPPTTPAAPSNLFASAISDSEIGLTWNDNAINESSYEVIRTGPNGTETIAALAADEVSYLDTGLQASTQYSYTVRAVNSQGSSANSNIATVTTLSDLPEDQIIDNVDADLSGPWTVGAFSADKWDINYAFRGKSATGINHATFSFEAQKSGLYEIFEWHPAGGNRPTDAEHIIAHAGGSDTVIVNQQVNGGQWNSLGTYALNEGGSYYVRITDKFLVGDVVMADGIKVVWHGDMPPAPDAPTGLSATSLGTSQVDLSWTNNAANVQSFEIVRNGTVLTTVPSNTTSYSDTAASECTPYTYVVRAVAFGIKSVDSNAVTVTLDETSPVVTAPAPLVVSTDASSNVATAVDLGTATADDNCDSNPAITNDAPAAFPIGDTTVTWTATDAHGNVGTATQVVTVQDTEAPVITAPAGVTVVATAADCFASDVALGVPDAADNTGVTTITNDAPTTYPVGTTTVTWTASDAYGNTASAVQIVTVEDNPVTAPESVTATALAWNTVLVSWSAVSNATLYEVRYATNIAGPYTVAASEGAGILEFEVDALLPNTTYYFVVAARNACGIEDSSVAQVTTPLYSGSSTDPEANEGWETVEDENAQGGSYIIRARRSTDEAAAWSMTVPVNGTYAISVYIPQVNKLSTQANYKITNGSSEELVVINQRQNTGTWVELGQFQFVAGNVDVSVFQPNNSSNPVVVDGLVIDQIN